MPVLEAMATGLPAVTTDCLGVRTFCKHGENCLVGLPDDVAGESSGVMSYWVPVKVHGAECAQAQHGAGATGHRHRAQHGTQGTT